MCDRQCQWSHKSDDDDNYNEAVAKTFVVCYIGNCVDLITRVPGLKDLNKRYGQSVCVCAT